MADSFDDLLYEIGEIVSITDYGWRGGVEKGHLDAARDILDIVEANMSLLQGLTRCPDCNTAVEKSELPAHCKGCGAYLVVAVEKKDKAAGDPRRQQPK